MEVLYAHGDGRDAAEFAIDLCEDSSPNQIVVACIEATGTLADMLASLDKKISGFSKTEDEVPQLLDIAVPMMYWDIMHRFTALEGKIFTNADGGQDSFGLVLQDIRFKFDEYGADLKSWAAAYACMPSSYQANKPFLLYIKKRGAATPFFVMWVDNAELLVKK